MNFFLPNKHRLNFNSHKLYGNKPSFSLDHFVCTYKLKFLSKPNRRLEIQPTNFSRGPFTSVLRLELRDVKRTCNFTPSLTHLYASSVLYACVMPC